MATVWERLIQDGIISEEMITKAYEMQGQNRSGLGFNLALLGADEEKIAQYLAVNYGTEYIDLLNTEPNSQLFAYVPRDKAMGLVVFPVRMDGNVLHCACADPSNPELPAFARELGFKNGVQAEFGVSPESYIKLMIEQLYPKEAVQSAMTDTLRDMNAMPGSDDLEVMKDSPQTDDAESVDEGPVIKLCNSIIADAVERKVSDIHIEPFEKSLKIRYRLDGNLIEQPSPPFSYKRAVTSRFKVMARLDIMERRKPQDGKIKIKVKDRTIDLRVSTLPVVWGEKIVMRILDQQNLNLDLTKLGFEASDLEKFVKAINSPYGILLVTGPTGSGKTTTLYSALSTINSPDVNIMTAEDPVEYNLPNVNQVAINPDVGMTFASALKAFLRQDPDVIMVGEIRDKDTADIAIKAALTGHLVVSTLHTNDAPTTISRMMDMGIEPFYIGSSVLLVLAQRLLRKICNNCKAEFAYEPAILKDLGIADAELAATKFYKGQGCDICNGTGYKGRIAIYEVMPVDDKLKEAIMAGVNSTELRKVAQASGMNTLRDSALIKLKKGMTTPEEVISVTLGG